VGMMINSYLYFDNKAMNFSLPSGVGLN
jgi:hypothetical protein